MLAHSHFCSNGVLPMMALHLDGPDQNGIGVKGQLALGLSMPPGATFASIRVTTARDLDHKAVRELCVESQTLQEIERPGLPLPVVFSCIFAVSERINIFHCDCQQLPLFRAESVIFARKV